MHELNVLIIGPSSFVNTLNELKTFLKFNLSVDKNLPSEKKLNAFDIFICHFSSLDDQKIEEILANAKCLKILACSKENKYSKIFDDIIELPTTLKNINNVIETRFAKNQFNKNSTIKVKDYFLDKNEKKLSKDSNSIILTEKEIKLLELLLENQKPITKNEILSKVWHYSNDADTHTVETHIYRLRKKITENFLDENFINNNKKGYYL